MRRQGEQAYMQAQEGDRLLADLVDLHEQQRKACCDKSHTHPCRMHCGVECCQHTSKMAMNMCKFRPLFVTHCVRASSEANSQQAADLQVVHMLQRKPAKHNAGPLLVSHPVGRQLMSALCLHCDVLVQLNLFLKPGGDVPSRMWR